MKIIKIPTFWNAEQADTVYQFLQELKDAIWLEYHADIQRMYEQIREEQNRAEASDSLDDEVDF